MAMVVCVFAVVVVLLLLQPWIVASTAVLVPPKGYSVGFTGYTKDAFQSYVCKGNAWSKTGSAADIYAPDGTKLGTYKSVIVQTERKYYWNIINSQGTYFESGQAISGLEGEPVRSIEVASSAISEYLAIIKAHTHAGDASQVAFVSLTGTSGGLAPRIELCSSSGATSSVPYSGNFTFFTQDRQPPAGVPASLHPPTNANFVQVVFLEGKVQYKFTSKGQWVYRGIFASIADVAGGTPLGKFGTVKDADKFGSKLFFQFKDPNGFWLAAQKASKGVQITSDGFPWQLLKITSSGGTVFPVGKITYVLIGGTMGGLAPRIAGRTAGMTWGSPFTAQCYLYAG